MTQNTDDGAAFGLAGCHSAEMQDLFALLGAERTEFAHNSFAGARILEKLMIYNISGIEAVQVRGVATLLSVTGYSTVQ